MEISYDYKDLLKILNEYGVKYLIIGAYAVIYYTEPRYTKDLDILIDPSKDNAEKVYSALKEFGAPLSNITVEDFVNKNLVYQIGIAPVRVDILMGVQGVDFDSVWRSRVRTTLEGIKVNIVGLKELIELKEKTQRDMDKRDLEELKYVWKKKKKKK